MWQEQAHRARREVADLAATGLGVSDLHAAALAVVGRRVGSELTCWASIDPQTLVISAMTGGPVGIPPEYEVLLARAEYSRTEPHTFAGLARAQRPLATLSDLTEVERARSARLNTVWHPLGLDQELRVLFVVDGACWGAAGFVRAARPFSDRETEFLAAVAPAVAAATRVAVRFETRGPVGAGSPAIVVVGSGGEVRAETAAAREWQDRLDAIAPDRFRVMMQAMAAGARAAAGTFTTRLRDASGHWAVLRASPLLGPDEEQVAVVIEPAGGDQLLGMLMEAYGLRSRERAVCREVIAGHSTADIAARLAISGHTVQDHLKSVFAKTGVRSRGELVALLRPAEAVTDAADPSR